MDILFHLISLSFPAFLSSALIYGLFWLDVHTILVTTASFCLYLFNFSFKEMIKTERLDSDLLLTIGHSMPCGQCSVMFFLCGYWIFCFWKYARGQWSYVTLIIRTCLIILYTAVFIGSRLSLQYNRPEDVIVAGIISTIWLIGFLKILKRKPKEFIKDD